MTQSPQISLRVRDLKRLTEAFPANDDDGPCGFVECMIVEPGSLGAHAHLVDRVVASMLLLPFLARAEAVGGSIFIEWDGLTRGSRNTLSILPRETDR